MVICKAAWAHPTRLTSFQTLRHYFSVLLGFQYCIQRSGCICVHMNTQTQIACKQICVDRTPVQVSALESWMLIPNLFSNLVPLKKLALIKKQKVGIPLVKLTDIATQFINTWNALKLWVYLLLKYVKKKPYLKYEPLYVFKCLQLQQIKQTGNQSA